MKSFNKFLVENKIPIEDYVEEISDIFQEYADEWDLRKVDMKSMLFFPHDENIWDIKRGSNYTGEWILLSVSFVEDYGSAGVEGYLCEDFQMDMRDFINRLKKLGDFDCEIDWGGGYMYQIIIKYANTDTLKYLKVFNEGFNEKAWLEDNHEEIIKEFCDELQDEDFSVNITPYEEEEDSIAYSVSDPDEWDFEIEIDIGNQIHYDPSEDFNKTIKEFSRKSLCMKLVTELLLRINSDGTFIIDEVSETDIDTILIKLKINR
jgi:hypothetical protein